MGFMEYSSMWDDKENCLYSFDNKNITHRESLIRTRNFSPGLASEFFSLIENYQFPALIRLATFFPHFFFLFFFFILHTRTFDDTCITMQYHDITMHIMILQCIFFENINQPTGTNTISALVWRACDKSAVVLFFEGEVLDKKLLGRCIIESAASQLEIFPAITMTDDSTFEVDWDESEAVDFIIVRNIL